MDEYTHVVIDKNNVGLDMLRQRIRARGLLTAEASGYQLADGSIKLEHHLHVFLWDSTPAGEIGRRGIIVNSEPGTTFRVIVRCPHFTKDGIFFREHYKAIMAIMGHRKEYLPMAPGAIKGTLNQDFVLSKAFMLVIHRVMKAGKGVMDGRNLWPGHPGGLLRKSHSSVEWGLRALHNVRGLFESNIN